MVLAYFLQEYAKAHIGYKLLYQKRSFFIYSFKERLGAWNVFLTQVANGIFKEEDSDFN